jgi:hypothetical protein
MHPAGPEPPAVYWRRRALVVGAAIVLIVVIVMIVKAAAGGGGSDKDVAATPLESAPLESALSEPPAVEVPDCTRSDVEVEAEATDSSFASPAKPTFTVSVRNKGGIKCVIDPSAVHVHVTSGDDRIFDSDDNCDDTSTEPAGGAGGTEAEPAGALASQSDEELLAELDNASGEEASVDAAEGSTADQTVVDLDASNPAADDVLAPPPDAATSPGAGQEVVLLEPGATEALLVPWNRERSAPTCEAYLLTTPGNGTYHAVFTVAGVESGDVTFELS